MEYIITSSNTRDVTFRVCFGLQLFSLHTTEGVQKRKITRHNNNYGRIKQLQQRRLSSSIRVQHVRAWIYQFVQRLETAVSCVRPLVQKDPGGVPFHRFPTDATVRNKWIRKLQLEVDLVNPHSRVCSKRFPGGHTTKEPQLT